MEKTEFLTKLGRILEHDGDELADDLPIDPKHWDSVEMMGTLALIDRTGKTVTVAEIQNCRTVVEVLRLVGLASADPVPTALTS